MRDYLIYNSTRAWEKYHAQKLLGWPYSGSAALMLDDGICGEHNKRHEPGASFAPYWTALELIKEGKEQSLRLPLEEILSRCKKVFNDKKEDELFYKHKPDSYNGCILEWRTFMPCDERYNDSDTSTQCCTLPFALTNEQKMELREKIFIEFHDKYCDGRQTGQWFTTWIRIFSTPNKTFIYHRLGCDC